MPDSGKTNLIREWYRLDNAATLYSLVTSARNPCIFRLEAVLKHPVNINRLQLALDNIIERFPYYRVNLLPGVFWHYWNTNLLKPRIIADSTYPCEVMPVTKRGIFPYRVRAHANVVAVEFHHSITDGTGGLVFLKSLVAEYLRYKGIKIPESETIYRPDQTPDLMEYEDAYKRYYKEATPSPTKQSKVFKFPYRIKPDKPYIRTRAELSLEDVITVSKKMKISITELLTAVLLESMQDILFSIPPPGRRRKVRPIRILVPVNLRNIYETSTMRNFTLYVNPEIDPRLGRYSFDDIIKSVYHYMKSEINDKFINKQITRNVRAELHPLLRVTPLFLKKILLRIVYTFFYSSVNNAVFSNLGKIDIPAAMEKEVEAFHFFLTPNKDGTMCLCMLGYMDKLYIDFGRVHEEPDIEKLFFRKLANWGVRIKIK
ncbi:MAG: hypothetical protein JXB88_22330 [Spirochaetales bacterium]|nr:hypothetical protein [Spirochaetales bacterium]